jgi:hypothetical protein
MLTLLAAAVEHSAHEGSKTAFYVAGGVLAGWAVLVGALGVARERFADDDAPGRVVMAVSVLLALTTMAMAVVTS